MEILLATIVRKVIRMTITIIKYYYNKNKLSNNNINNILRDQLAIIAMILIIIEIYLYFFYILIILQNISSDLLIKLYILIPFIKKN